MTLANYQICCNRIDSKSPEERREMAAQVAGDFWEELKKHHVDETAGECKYLIYAKVSDSIVGTVFLGDFPNAKCVFDLYQRATTSYYYLSFMNIVQKKYFDKGIEVITDDFKTPKNPIYAYNLYVSPENRECGVGKNLIRTSVSFLKKSNHDALVLECKSELYDFYKGQGLAPLMKDNGKEVFYFATRIK